MPNRLALGAAAFLLSCGHGAPHGGSDGAGGDGAIGDGAVGDGAGPDAPVDGSGADTRPPTLLSTTPASDTWLEEPVRLVFDEAIDPASLKLTATAMLAGSAITTHVALDWDPKVVAISLDPSVRGLGALDVHVDGTVADAAGNKTTVTTDVQLHVAPWSSPAVDFGPASSSPATAIDGRGAVLAAWTIGSAGSRHVVVGQLYGGEWQQIGTPLGTADCSAPALAIDSPLQRPVVAWVEAGTAHVARWGNGMWTELASPGTGSVVALAAAPGGDPVVAVFGSTASIATLVNDAWQPVGGTLNVGALVGEPALAVGSAGHPAVGWIAGNAVHVYRFDSAWTALAPINLPAPPAGIDHMSLAMHGNQLVVAYDAWSGSFGVLAAKATGTATTWTRLDHLLDLDAQSDAIAPAVAIDASGAPVVAWTELVDGMHERGLVGRWSGSKWTIVGGTPWLADAAAPTRPTITLHAGGAPVIGYSAGGQLGIARFNGPAAAPPGRATRASIAGCSFNPANPPAQLLSTGCFTVSTPGQPTPHPGLVPYGIVVQLWTDGAKKRRWIALPDGAAMTTSSTGAWDPPVGTFMIKEFAYERTPGTGGTRRAMETRILAKTASGWQGFSYQWNPAGTNASLLTDGEWTYDWPLDDGSTHRHLYPSRSECVSCHEGSYGPLLGLRAPQLARWFDYDGQVADQLQTLSHLGVGPGTAATPFVSPHDASETVEHRMRGYMAANCAHCHNPNHIAVHDLRYTTPLPQTNLCPDIVPGDPAASKTYQLVSSRPGMPALGTLAVNPLAVSTLGSWISGMTSCP